MVFVNTSSFGCCERSHSYNCLVLFMSFAANPVLTQMATFSDAAKSLAGPRGCFGRISTASLTGDSAGLRRVLLVLRY